MLKLFGFGGFTAATCVVLAGVAALAVPEIAAANKEVPAFTQKQKKAIQKIIQKNTPKAFAAVNADGTLQTGYKSRRIGSITHPVTGVYCFQLDFIPKTASANATPSAVNEDSIVAIDLVSPFNNCPADAEAEVRLFDASGAIEDDDTFLVQFD